MPVSLSLAALVPKLADIGDYQARLDAHTFVGIDFGTSTTVASYAVIGDGACPVRAEPIPIPQLLPDGRTLDTHLVPSAVAWSDGQLLVGAGAAVLRGSLTPGRDVWSSFKMELGVDLGPQYYNSVLGPGHPVATIQTPRDAATTFFRYIRERIETVMESRGLPRDVSYSVSIPASFESNQRADLLAALETAGLRLPSRALIDEPNAAFLSYLAEASANTLGAFRLDRRAPLHVLVFDFGAGTCDISILEIGQRAEGNYYSKNVAISRFQPLGGDDVDREVARCLLLPQLLEESKVSVDSLTTADLKKRVIPQLMRPAEELKIAICRHVASNTVGGRLPPVAVSDEPVALGHPIRIRAARREFTLRTPKITFRQFADTVSPFLQSEIPGPDQARLSTFEAIRSATRKAGLSEDDLDLVLLIGGSSANPYLQASMRQCFSSTELEIPQDLRSHVSRGAAINSLLLNGLGETVIRPITSEPIMAVTRNNSLRVLLPPGTEIPCEPVTVTGLSVAQDGQRAVQIPVCVTNERKLLNVIEVKSKNDNGFSADSPVSITCEVTEDKILMVSATVGGALAVSAVLNPFANSELTTEQRAVLEAERAANLEAARSGGRPNAEVLLRLGAAYEEAGEYLRAAETVETAKLLNDAAPLESRLCYLFSCAGRKAASAEWARRAYARQRSPVTAFNLALSELAADHPEVYERLMQEALEMDDEAAYVLAHYGRWLHVAGDRRGLALLQRALDLLLAEATIGTLDKDDYPRLVSAAKALGRDDVAESASRQYHALSKQSGHYRDEALLYDQSSAAPVRR